MTPLPKRTIEMNLRLLFSYKFLQSKLRNGTKTFLEPKVYVFIVKFKKLGFTAPLIYLWYCWIG